jgi:hypothetical protein
LEAAKPTEKIIKLESCKTELELHVSELEQKM